jgi:outer membrane cobalamin receptor
MTCTGGYQYKVNGTPGMEADPTLDDRQRDLRGHGTLTARWDLNEHTALKLSGHAARSRLDYLFESWDGMNETLSQETNRETEAQIIVQESKNTLVLGWRYRLDELDHNSIGPKDASIRSGYAQNSLILVEAWTVTASMRYDDHSVYGEDLSPMVAVLWKVHDRLELKGTAGTAFRAPAFSDLYWPEDMFSRGNPGLRPERSTSFESGFTANAGPALTLSAVYFKNEIRDFIQWAPEDPSDMFSLWTPSNVGRVLLFGWDNELKVRPCPGVTFYINHTWLNARDTVLDQDLIYRSRNRANAGVSFKWGPLSLSAGSEYRDNRLGASGETLPPVMTSKVRVEYEVTENAELTLSSDNIENARYELRESYPMPGRTVTGGMRLTF